MQMTLFANSKDELMALLQRTEHTSLEVGMIINKWKTKIMVLDRKNNNRLQTQKLMISK